MDHQRVRTHQSVIVDVDELDLIAEEAASLIDCHGIVSDHPGPTFDKPLYRDDARRLAHVVGIGLER
jgi:hypothetical protein